MCKIKIISRKTICCPLYYLKDERRVRKVAKSTVLKVVRRVTTAISRLLGPQYIKHPLTMEKVEEIATHFQE